MTPPIRVCPHGSGPSSSSRGRSRRSRTRPCRSTCQSPRKKAQMTDETKTPEQEQTDALLAEVDRLNAQLGKANARELIPVEEQQRRHAAELAGIVFGPNTGAVG